MKGERTMMTGERKGEREKELMVISNKLSNSMDYVNAFPGSIPFCEHLRREFFAIDLTIPRYYSK